MLTKILFSFLLLITASLLLLAGYVFISTRQVPSSLMIFPFVTAVLTVKMWQRVKGNNSREVEFSQVSNTCPFCGNGVRDGYHLCGVCKAQKITSLKTLFEKELSLNRLTGMLGIFGLVIGFGLGFATFGLTNIVFVSAAVGIAIFLIVMLGPTFIKSCLLWEKSKVHWYR